MVAFTAFYTILLAFSMKISLHACLNPPPGLHQQPNINSSQQQHVASGHVPGCQGPKSLGGVLTSAPAVDAASSTDARVGVCTARTPRADQGVSNATAVAKQCGRADRQQPCPRFRKRALLRAQRRALQAPDGRTFYRGRWVHARALGCDARTVRQRQETQATTGARLRVLSLNLGSMDSMTYDVFMTWLSAEGKHYDILMLQETHHGLGKQFSEWVIPGYTFVSSPDPQSRYAGVAMLIATRVAKSAQVRHQVHVAGRLLHVRVPIGSGKQAAHLDLVCVYQWAWDADPEKQRAAKRQALWQRLDALLRSLPQRNSKCIAGDFNCALRPRAGCVGQHLHRNTAGYPDVEDFGVILETHHLCALNTWTRAAAHPTYKQEGDQARSAQIDFILTGQPSADSQARSSCPRPSICFSPWRGGGRHFAVQASLKLHQHFTPKPATAAVSYSCTALREALRQPESPLRCSLYHNVSNRLHQVPAEALTAERLNQEMHAACCALFPVTPLAKDPRPWQQSQHDVKELWRCHSALKAVRREHIAVGVRSRMAQVFQILRVHTQLQACQRALRKRGRERRKQLILTSLSRAEAAAQAGDMYKLFQEVRRLAPKSPKERVQIRSPDGRILSETDELQAIVQYFTDVFCRDKSCQHTIQALQGPYSIRDEEIIECFSKQPAGKAVPVGSVPTEVWKLCMPEVLPRIRQLFDRHLQGHLQLPHTWRDCHLYLLPKPSKPAKLPSSLRPIALQCPLGKCLARVVQRRLLERILPALERTAQFAYLPGRSTHTALALLAQHCNEARTHLVNSRIEVGDRRLGRSASIMGAAMLSVDLSLAFDRVSHQYLSEALRFLNVDQDTITLILSIHRAKYHVQHGQQASSFDICNGIRQGCTLSPLLWVSVTHYLLHRFGLKAGANAKESLILFADDFLAKFILRDMRDVQALTTHVRYLFETLEEACMTANPEKSKLHIKAAGIPLKKWLHARTVTRKGTKCLAIQTPFDTLFLPLCDSLTYLGAIVSYGAYEDQTAEHRVRAAQANVARLAKHLFTQHGMGLRVRLRLFLTCVRSSLLYGITPIGITSKSLSLLQRFEAKYIRKLARSPAHLTLERTQDLYHRLQIPTLYAALTSRANSSLEACEKPFRYPGQESVKTWLQLKLRDLAECIQLTQTSLTKVTAEGITTEGVPCPVCGIYFGDQHAMRAHATQRHDMRFTTKLDTAAGRNIDPRKHSLGGMPTCRHCKRAFRKWGGLKGHVLNACPVLQSRPPQPPGPGQSPVSQLDNTPPTTNEPLSPPIAPNCPVSPTQQPPLASVDTEDPTLQAVAHVQVHVDAAVADWVSFAEAQGKRLKDTCIFCSQWCSKGGGVKQHIRRTHPDHWKHHDDVQLRLKKHYRLKYKGVCKACSFTPTGSQAGALHTPNCPAYYQACLLHVITRCEAHDGGPNPSRDGSGRNVCIVHASTGSSQVCAQGGLRCDTGEIEVSQDRAVQGHPRQGPREPWKSQAVESHQTDGVPTVARHSDRGDCDGTPGVADEVVPQTRGPPRGVPSRHLLHDVPGHIRGSLHHRQPLSGDPEVASHEERQPGEADVESQSYAPDDPLHGAARAHGHGPQGGQAWDPLQALMAQRVRSGDLELPKVGPSNRSRGRGRRQDRTSTQRGVDHHPTRAAVDPRNGPHTEISQHQTSGGRVCERRASIHAHGVQPRGSGAGTLRPLSEALGPQRDEVDRIAPPTTSSTSPALGPDPGASGIRSVAGRPAEQPERRGPVREWPAGTPACSVLLNPGQICYMNASVTLLHWLV